MGQQIFKKQALRESTGLEWRLPFISGPYCAHDKPE